MCVVVTQVWYMEGQEVCGELPYRLAVHLAIAVLVSVGFSLHYSELDVGGALEGF